MEPEISDSWTQKVIQLCVPTLYPTTQYTISDTTQTIHEDPLPAPPTEVVLTLTWHRKTYTTTPT